MQFSGNVFYSLNTSGQVLIGRRPEEKKYRLAFIKFLPSEINGCRYRVINHPDLCFWAIGKMDDLAF
jgi:hypothetical protein